MKKLHSIALYALATPFITLGAGSVLAQQSTSQDMDRQQQTSPSTSQGSSSTQRNQGAMPSSPSTSQGSSTTQRDPSASPSAPKAAQGSTREPGAMPSSPSTSQGAAQGAPRAGQSSQSAVEAKKTSGASMEHKGFISAVPAKGMQANDLIGAEVKTSGDVDVGPVSDLIINDSGHVVAIVVSVGGFLGMGEREVAIGWADVTRPATSSGDDLELQISSTREELLAAPEYKKITKKPGLN